MIAEQFLLTTIRKSGSPGRGFREEKFNEKCNGRKSRAKKGGKGGEEEERKGEKGEKETKRKVICMPAFFAKSGQQPAAGASLFQKGLFINTPIKKKPSGLLGFLGYWQRCAS